MINKIKNFLHEKGVYDWLDLLPYKYRMLYWDKIKPVFKPHHSRLRKAIPRNWTDITSLIVDVNFEFIKSFYEDEYKNDTVDWKSTKEHSKFEAWLKEAYRYITIERAILQTRLDNSYPPSRPLDEMFRAVVMEDGKKAYELIDDGIPYNVKYKKVISLEKTINKKDTKILTEMIKNRDFFWT